MLVCHRWVKDFTFQFTQGFSNICECKWGNIKISSSDPYILIAFLSLYFQQYFKKHIIIKTRNHEFISSCCSLFIIRQTLFSLTHRFAVCALTLAASEHTKKVKSFEIKWQHCLLPQKCWNCEWSWAVPLGFIYLYLWCKQGKQKVLL